jgi:rubredoxin
MALVITTVVLGSCPSCTQDKTSFRTGRIMKMNRSYGSCHYDRVHTLGSCPSCTQDRTNFRRGQIKTIIRSDGYCPYDRVALPVNRED